MTVNQPRSESKRSVSLEIYDGYEMGKGGLPFGHCRVFHVELKIDGKTICRSEDAASRLKELVRKFGKPIGNSVNLKWDPSYRHAYRQEFELPGYLTAERIEAEIPSEPIRLI